MLASIVCLIAVGFVHATVQGPDALRPGSNLEGRIEEGGTSLREIHTKALDEKYPETPTVGLRFEVRVAESGAYHIDLRSHLFDGYLVLRDEHGSVLAEDDDGLLRSHARIVHELEAGKAYVVEVCALHGERGPFELMLVQGPPEQLSRQARVASEIDDARRGIAAIEVELGPKHEQLGTALHDLAKKLRDRRDLAAARPLYERALAIRIEAHGYVDGRTDRTMGDLALLYVRQRSYEKARALFEKKLAVREEALGPDHPLVAETLELLGAVLSQLKSYEEAVSLLERALVIRETSSGPEHPRTANVLANLALMEKNRRDYARAEALYERALAIRKIALGLEHPKTAKTLYGLAESHQRQGEHRAAREHYEQALRVHEKILDPNHRDLALTLYGLASCLRDLGDDAAAKPLLERALAIREKAFGPNHPQTAAVLGSLAALHAAAENYEVARKFHERGLAIREKTLGPNHLETAKSVNNLATLYYRQGKNDLAKPLYERALAIHEKVRGPEHPAVAVQLTNLGSLHMALEDYEAAKDFYERALSVIEKARGTGNEKYVVGLNNLAMTLKVQGSYEESQRIHERAISIAERALGPEHPSTATSLFKLALLFREQGLYEAAKLLYERALAIREKVLGLEHLQTAEVLVSLGRLAHLMGSYEEARVFCERALAIHEKLAGPRHSLTARSLNALAVVLKNLGSTEEARALYERAIAIDESVLGPERRETATSLGNLAILLMTQRSYEEALPLLERSLVIHEAVLGSGHPGTASALVNYAAYHHAMGEHAASRNKYERALEILEHSRDRGYPSTIAVIHELLHLEADLGRVEEAWRWALEFCDHGSERVLNQLALSTGGRRFVVAGEQRERLSHLLSCLPEGANREARLDDAWSQFTAWKGVVFRHGSRISRSLSAADMDPTIVSLRSKLRSLDRQLSEQVFERDIESPEEHVARFERLRAERAETQLELLRHFGIVPRRERTSARELSALLPAGSAVLDFTFHTPFRFAKEGARREPTRLLCWIVRAGESAPHLVDLGEVMPLREVALREQSEFSSELRGVRTRRRVEAGAELRKALWDPLAKHLPGVRMLFLVPSGFVAEIPFGAIPLKNGKYLLEEMTVVYAQDPVTLRNRLEEPTPNHSATPSLMVLGGVDYGSVAGRFEPLPHTREEVEGVLALHAGAFEESATTAIRLNGDDATEDSFARSVSGQAIVHLATHGFYEREGIASLWENAMAAAREEEALGASLEDAPPARPKLKGEPPELLSGLVFAGANDGARENRGDGVLTAQEVGGLDLQSCELAVLSACQTALGTGRSGEGLLSLRRAFREAGARTVIASLWKVDDEATRVLLTQFYENLWLKKMGPSAALRAAQLSMRRGKRFASPAYWAAFTLSGEWR